MHVVTVVFRINPGDEARFMQAMRANATASLALEPGCKQFDVCSVAGGSEIFLYEIYDDAGAFEEHKRMPHYLSFDAETRDWVADKQVSIYDLVQGGPS